MSTQTSREIEARGRTVDDAVQAGLSRLGLAYDDVVIDVIDEGSRGILGLGSRDAVVLLKPLAAPEPAPPEPVVAPVVPSAPKPEPVDSLPPVVEAASGEVDEDDVGIWVEETSTEFETTPSTATIATEGEVSELATESDTAVAVITQLLEGMQVNATVSVRISEEDDLTHKRVNIIDIEGDDLGVLIGQRGEILNAMQYLSRLIVGHRLQDRASFVVDVEGYRERRHQALARLAERMAQKAVKRQSAVTLEAMSPYERRIIHITLRDSDEVYTESTGDGNRRRVRIYPKN